LADLKFNLPDARCVVVDGKSSDRTVEMAKNTGAQILMQDGLGKGDAIAKAINSTDLTDGYVVFIDADFSYPARYLPKMMQILDEHPQVGMVIGNGLTTL
jgi:dolichol-phosphate mannosyltransferase